MNPLEKVECTASVRHFERFSKSGILIYNSEVPGTAGRKTKRRRRTQAIAKRYAFHANATSFLKRYKRLLFLILSLEIFRTYF